MRQSTADKTTHTIDLKCLYMIYLHTGSQHSNDWLETELRKRKVSVGQRQTTYSLSRVLAGEVLRDTGIMGTTSGDEKMIDDMMQCN